MKKKKNGRKVVLTTMFLCLVVAGICFLCVPLFKDLKFGLDLQGGFEVLYKVESVDGSKMTSEKMTATYKTSNPPCKSKPNFRFLNNGTHKKHIPTITRAKNIVVKTTFFLLPFFFMFFTSYFLIISIKILCSISTAHFLFYIIINFRNFNM